MILTFAPPAKPWSTNEDRNLHKYKRAELIRLWHEATQMHTRSVINVYGIVQEPGIVRLQIPFKVDRRRDPHNYCGTVLKAVIDGLVGAGVWPDDTPEWVGHREPVLYKGNLVVVEITPMNGAE